ncbi:glycosyltransferase [Sediminibacterium roseum]|uniref:Glycosyltransferase n=1 Tax=Sediminibacterium roseum TaxID=1978412 RepID=A0ABW9ZTK9_9BACT|nr:glycosyltransferase [Sediminibacterium roseum]NCI49092.1 glycosyltransferase [Sediminibacterium roseum]
MSRLIFFVESYTAGGSDQVARVLLENLACEKIYLIVNSSIDKRIILAPGLPDHVSVYTYHLVTPMDIGLFANRFRHNKLIFLTLKAFDYIVRYPLLLFSFFYFLVFMMRFRAHTFIAHNGGYPGGLFCGTAAMASYFLPSVKKRFYAFHSMPRPVAKNQYWFDRFWDHTLDKLVTFIAVSKKSAEQMNAVRMVKQKPICIYNGLKPSPRKEYAHTPVLKILHVGYFDYNKNQMLLVKCIAGLVQSGIMNIAVTFVGDIDEPAARKEIDEYVAATGISNYLTFTGFQKNVTPFYLSHDILVSTSKIESFPIVILEAMRVGMPVVATKAGGVAEQVNDGITGYLVNSDDIAAMMLCLQSFIDNRHLIQTMGSAAHHLFESQFTVNHMISEYDHYLGLKN